MTVMERLSALPEREVDDDLVLARFHSGDDVADLFDVLTTPVWEHIPGGQPASAEALSAVMVGRLAGSDPP